MNRYIVLSFILICVCAVESFAKKKTVVEPSYAWQMTRPLGLRYESTLDTLFQDYAQRFVPGAIYDATATTGNYGAQAYNAVWMDQSARSDFFFRDGLEHWLPSPDRHVFYNTRIPMTLVSYNTGGGRDNAQDHLGLTFSGNVNSRLQIGARMNYIYSKGSYNYQSDKDLDWGFSASYIGDRYEFQGFGYHYNLVNKENGGITDSLYILDPALIQGGVSSVDPKTIPTRLSNAHSRNKGQHITLNNRYKVGYWYEQMEGDSVVSRTYIPVTSFFWNFDYDAARHIFRDDASGEISNYFDHIYLNGKETGDETSYWSIANTVGVSLLEGFHRYAKFGLAAYARHEVARYTQTVDTLGHTDLTPLPVSVLPYETEHNVTIGGQLTKQRGSILTYMATAEFGVTGRRSGDVNLNGQLTTRVPLLGDTVAVTAHGAFTNTAAPYFMQHFVSNHFAWENDFSKERRVRVGGRVTIPRTSTSLEAEVTNVENYLYFNREFLPQCHGDNVQVFSARLCQQLTAGPLSWFNRITYQTSSNEQVIPLPKLVIYSNLNLNFKIATLSVQLGMDCHYYTRYYAPNYQPATGAFANQQEVKFGNYPLMNAYANLKLSKTRFYIMWSHINQGWFSSDYFSMRHYPLNPRRFQIGLSVEFTN